MRSIIFAQIFSFFASIVTLNAQEQMHTNAPEKQASSLLLFGKLALHPVEHPMKKTRAIPKLELMGLFQKRISLGVEIPINYKTSFIVNASRKVLNTNEPQKAPGTYSHTFTVTDIETTTLLFINTHQILTSSAPFNDWPGNFLPTRDYVIQPKVRSYFGKKQSGNRFYCEPGFAVHLLSGVKGYNNRKVLNSTKTTDYGGFLIQYSSTETNTYLETRTVTGSEKRATVGISVGFGFQAKAGKRCVFDLSLEMASAATKGWRGMKRVSVLPQVQVGYRI
jgi:hypothetical protein